MARHPCAAHRHGHGVALPRPHCGFASWPTIFIATARRYVTSHRCGCALESSSHCKSAVSAVSCACGSTLCAQVRHGDTNLSAGCAFPRRPMAIGDIVMMLSLAMTVHVRCTPADPKEGASQSQSVFESLCPADNNHGSDHTVVGPMAPTVGSMLQLPMTIRVIETHLLPK